ncbi:MAG: trypsin-like peptidase domain-containing protein [Myxococcota bacterium]
MSHALSLLIFASFAVSGSVQAQELTENRRIEVARRLSESSVSVLVGRAGGSGFVAGDERWVITNSHVVSSARRGVVRIRFGDGTVAQGRVVATDPTHDLAVVEIVGDAPVGPLPLADSDDVQVGQAVLAFGSPFGLEGTLTQGIVSARRDIPGRSGAIRGIIQTDAPINPGNSGGPLVDSQGRVIGVNTAIISRTGGSNGIGFAVPSNYVTELLESLRSRAREPVAEAPPALDPPAEAPSVAIDTPVWLGIFGEDVQARSFRGIRVRRVIPGSPAEAAGVRGLEDSPPTIVERFGMRWTGHIILAVDGRRVSSMNDLHDALRRRQPGEQAVLTLTVGAGSMTGQAVVELQAPPERAAEAAEAPARERARTRRRPRR